MLTKKKLTKEGYKSIKKYYVIFFKLIYESVKEMY